MKHTFFAKMMAVGLVLVATGSARAQGGDENAAVKTRQVPQIVVTKAMVQALNRPAAVAEFGSLSSAWQLPRSSRSPFQSRSSLGRKIAYGIAGGVGGMFAGGAIGASVDHCRCDDPGLAGALVGMPIGAILGATFGVFLAGR